MLFVTLLWVNRGLLGAEFHETSDFAANSLLVQDAKRLELLTGNYSRIGFHHPGPGILYVLGAGEFLLHDVLRLVGSPIAGQVVAGLAWNAAWMAGLVSVLAVMFASTGAAARVTGIFIALTVLRNGQLLESIWMPSLYYMPFAVLLACLARVATGHLDRLFLLVLSSGFLIHGHAAFLVMVPPMVSMALASGVLLAWRREMGIAEHFRRQLCMHRGEALAAAGAAALFMSPLLVLTVRDFPGPLAAYITYGGDGRVNALRPAIGFVTRYWDSLVMLGVAAAVLIGFASGRVPGRRIPARETAIGVAVAFAVASFMVFVYARHGVDDLGHWYVGMFYTSAAIIVESVAMVLLLDMLPLGATATLGIAASALAFTAAWLQPTGLLGSSHAPELARLLSSFERPFVLDLDNRVDEGGLWSSMLGATAYLARRGEIPFCIRRNWHVSYTHALRCTPAQEQAAAVVTAASSKGDPLPSSVVADGVALAATPPPLAYWDASVPVHAGGPLGLLGRGWSHPEQGHTWTEGPVATLSFRAPETRDFVLELEMLAFLPDPQFRQVVAIAVNGRMAEVVEFGSPAQWRTVQVQVPAAAVAGRTHVVVRLDIARPVSPKHARISEDGRRLGIALKRLTLRP